MKTKQFKDQLLSEDLSRLNEKLTGLRRELFMTRVKAVAAPTKDNSSFKKLRKNIARVLTMIHMRETNGVKG